MQTANGQNAVDVKSFKQKFYDVLYLNNEVVYTKSANGIDANTILENSNFEKAKTALHYIDIKSFNAWFKFNLENSDEENVVVSFTFPKADSAKLYYLINNAKAQLISSLTESQVYYDTLNSGDQKQYFLHLKSIKGPLGKQGISIYTDQSLNRLKYRQGEKMFDVVIINSLFIGAIIILFFYHFFLYLQNRRKIYIPYFLYILTLAIYFFAKHPLFMMYYATDEVHASGFFAFNILIQPFIYIFYAQFTRAFWQTEEKYHSIDRLLTLIIRVSITTVVVYVMLIYFNHPFLRQIHDYYRIALIGLSVYILVYFSRYYTKETRYYIIGASCYLFFSFLALADSKFDITDYRNIFMQIGTILEILFFAFGLGYKMKKIEIEKIETQDKLIQQYAENDQLQKDLEIELKKELSISQKENELMELESRLLRSRMNPHFLFNSMNALKSNIIKNKTKEAGKYLDQLSLLLRHILEYSGESKISLKQELVLLENYLQLEQERLSYSFDYEINFDDDTEIDFIKLPPMLLQPFVENSIWHGIRHLESRRGLIKILIVERNDLVQIAIEDNGIGRKKTKELRIAQASKPKSLATTLTKQRIDLLKKHNKFDIRISIVDKPLDQGTIVKLSIKDNL